MESIDKTIMRDKVAEKPSPKKRNQIFRKYGDKLFYAALLILPLLQVAVFYFGVNIQSVFMAFQSYETVTDTFTWGIGPNWTKFVSDVTRSAFWQTVGNSFLLWIVTSLIGVSLAVLFALYIYKRNRFGDFFRVVLFLPSMLPVVLLVVLYKRFEGQGIPAYMQLLFGMKMTDVFTQASTMRFWVITLFTLWISFGSQVLVYTGAMDQIPSDILEAGQIDGASETREFVSIILPGVLPTIGTFLITGVAGIFTNQNNLFYFIDGYLSDTVPAERTVGFYLYCLVYENSGMDNYCYASFLGIIFTIVAVPLAIFTRKIVNRSSD